ncbi:MAG: two-component system sensor histidine kinase ChvG [Halioglobus sp.]|jgi:two-component system sensor histidine kinase ChvG
MSLRRQLLMVSLLLLSLPWAGCQFVREMEGALRHGQEQSLHATAQAVAAVINNKPQLLYPNVDRMSDAQDSRPSIYANPQDIPVIVDGYADGWEELTPYTLVSENSSKPLAVSYRAITRGDRLYLLLQIEDASVIYHNPGLSPQLNGDRLVLRTWENNRRQDYVIATAAPGQVRARYESTITSTGSANRIQGQWQDSVSGYTLELQMPLAVTGGRLGFYVINATAATDTNFQTLGNITPLETAPPPWLIYTPAPLADTIAPFARKGRQLEIIDRYKWRVASNAHVPQATTEPVPQTEKTFWLVRAVYRSILSSEVLQARTIATSSGKVSGREIDDALAGYTANQRYRDKHNSSSTTLTATSPIFNSGEVIGAVLLRQSSEEYLSLTDQAFSRLLGYSLTAIGIGVFGLLGFATVLSWRIRKLSQAATAATQGDQLVLNNFPRSTAPDEIGELSRSYADLLEKIRQYNDYLRTLSRKLSHELRTPIAVIQTSLENLEQHQEKNAESDIYLNRAQGGLSRLSGILSAMAEASGLEESIRANNKSPLDLVPLLREVFGAYKSLYCDHSLLFYCDVESAIVTASPELLVQLLDKLMDNAVSFSPVGGTIKLRLAAEEEHWNISVENTGPLLSKNMQDQLFGSMVSVREKGSDSLHLGLGLHIVQLIADFHEAQVEIKNLEDGSGVSCSLIQKRQLL